MQDFFVAVWPLFSSIFVYAANNDITCTVLYRIFGWWGGGKKCLSNKQNLQCSEGGRGRQDTWELSWNVPSEGD